MWLLYDLIIISYETAIRIAALFNSKAGQWVRGRKGQWKRMEETVGQLEDWTAGKDRLIWFHCASLGEFEQGRPVIEAFRQKHPDWKIILTFFSPSGYEIRKNYEGADGIFYLPMDRPRNVRKFISLVNPSLAVLVKYEFWFRYIDRLRKKEIPIYIISGIFREDQYFFRWYGGWARKQLVQITHFFVQDVNSGKLLNTVGINNVTVSGDTRFDRVSVITRTVREFPFVESFCRNKKIFLAGSTWPMDEKLILDLIGRSDAGTRFIIASHEVGKQRIEGLLKQVGRLDSRTVGQDQPAVGSWQLAEGIGQGGVLFSQLNEEAAKSTRVLIIDGIGYLSSLYQYATVAYIGGGFGAGIHNILEAAAFGKPVIFGPNYRKFREAVDLIELGGAFSITSLSELREITLKLIDDREYYLSASDICRKYVTDNCGATDTILKGLSLKIQ